jgi:tetratricopeptide (TPR) repeat protein
MRKSSKTKVENTKKEFDVFLSYARADFERVSILRSQLLEIGLHVWFDETEIQNYEALQARIEQGLSYCKAFVCCYSKTYPQRRWCMAELAAAYTAAVNDKFEHRILLINFESGTDHITPASLLDRLLPSLTSNDAEEAESVAKEISTHIPHLDSILGQLGVAAVPRWFGPTRLSSPRFVNRVRELWSIHEALIEPQRVMSSGSSSRGVCQIRAIGGMGKSLLVEEYAWRFSAAWSLGIIWLDAGGDEARRLGQSSEHAEEKLSAAMQNTVRQLGGNPTGMVFIDMQIFIRNRVDEMTGLGLWVVDDLPSDLDIPTVRNWLAPHQRLRTLITTRSRQYDSMGATIDLKSLETNLGSGLLASDYKDIPTWAIELTSRLGGHPLALDVTRAALVAMRGIQSPEQFLAMLEHPEEDVLELASDLADELPNGHERNITQTLLTGLKNLPNSSRNLLILMSMCSETPIPIALLVRACSELAQQQKTKPEMFVIKNTKLLHDRALCARDEDGSLIVHTLVSRSVRYREIKTPKWPAFVAMMRNALVDLLGGFERYDDLAQLSLLAPHARSTVEFDTNEPERLWHCLGQYEYTAGRFEHAAKLLRKSWEMAKNKWGLANTYSATIANEYGLAASEAHHVDDAIVAFESFSQFAESLGPSGVEQLMLAKGNIAAALRNGGQVKESVKLEREVANWRELNLGVNHPLTLTSYHQLAIAEWHVGNQLTALDLERKALAGRRRILGDEHMHTLLSMQSCAQYEAQFGSMHNALALAKENARRRVSLLGKEHPYAISGLRTALGLSVGEEFFKELGINADEIPGLSWQQRNNHAIALLTEGQYEDSLTIIDELFSVQTDLSDQEMLILRHNRAAALIQLGRQPEAAREIQQLISEENQLLGEQHWLTLASRYYQALNTKPEISDEDATAMLEPVANSMKAHLPPENLYRMRCELELELHRAMCGPKYCSPDRAHEIVARVANLQPDIYALSANCVENFVALVHKKTHAFEKFLEAIDELITKAGDHHPDCVRYRWLLCRYLYDKKNQEWINQYRLISQLIQQNLPRNRIEAWVLHQIKFRNLEKEAGLVVA